MADSFGESVVPSRGGIGPVLCGCGQVAGIPCLNVGQSRGGPPPDAAGAALLARRDGGDRLVDARSVAAKDVAPAAIAVAVERSRAAIVDSTARAAAWTALTAAPVAWALQRNRDGGRGSGGQCVRDPADASRRSVHRDAVHVNRRHESNVMPQRAGQLRKNLGVRFKSTAKMTGGCRPTVGVASSAWRGPETRCSSGLGFA